MWLLLVSEPREQVSRDKLFTSQGMYWKPLLSLILGGHTQMEKALTLGGKSPLLEGKQTGPLRVGDGAHGTVLSVLAHAHEFL